MRNPKLCLVNLYLYWSKSDWIRYYLTFEVDTFIFKGSFHIRYSKIIQYVPGLIHQVLFLVCVYCHLDGIWISSLSLDQSLRTRRPAMQAWRDAETYVSSWSRVKNIWSYCLPLKRTCSFFRWNPHFEKLVHITWILVIIQADEMNRKGGNWLVKSSFLLFLAKKKFIWVDPAGNPNWTTLWIVHNCPGFKQQNQSISIYINPGSWMFSLDFLWEILGSQAVNFLKISRIPASRNPRDRQRP